MTLRIHTYLRILLAVTAFLTCSYGIAKLFIQRANLPAYAARYEQSFEGFVAIDHYAHRADLIRRACVEGDISWEDVSHEFEGALHPASILIPGLVAALAILCGSIPASFAFLSLGAHLLSALGIGWIVRRQSEKNAAVAGTVASILFLSHVLTIRTAAQFYMDPFCNLWAIVATALIVEWSHGEGSKRRISWALLAVLSTGLLVKISLLPLLVVPVLVRWTAKKRDWRLVARAGAAFGLLPLVLPIWWMWWIGDPAGFLADVSHLDREYAFTSRQLLHFAVEMSLLFQALPLLALWRVPDWRHQRAITLPLILLLASTWAFGLPPIPRLYLPVLGLGLALVVPGCFRDLKPRVLWAALLAYLVVNYSIAVVGLGSS